MMDGLFLLAHGSHIGPCVDVVFHDGWIQPRHFSVRPGKDVAEFLEESFVGSDFFRGVGCPQHDFFNNLKIGLDVDFDGWRDVGHVPFFEGIWCRNGIFKPVNSPMNEILGLD